jgi:regulatory protein
VQVEEALESALRALGTRDRSAEEIDRRLRARGFPDPAREEVLARLRRTGLVDDTRFAETRARALAARGEGDAVIRHRLEQAGIERELIEAALESIEPEHERAQRIALARGRGPRTLRYLLSKGFAEDVVHALVADAHDGELG